MFFRASRRRRSVRTLAAITAGLLTLSACGSGDDASGDGSGGGSAVTHITLGLASNSALYGPVFYAQEQGLFEKYDLDVEVQSVSAAAAAAAFASGSVDIVNAGTAALTTIVKSKHGSIFMQGGFTAYRIMAKPEIKSISDLKGKTIASTAPGGANDLMVQLSLESEGLVPDQDVKVAYLGEDAAQVSAIKNGAIDAALLSPPATLQAEKLGFAKVADVGHLSSGSTYQVTDEFAEDHPDALNNWIKAMIESTEQGKADLDGMKVALKAGTGDNADENLEASFDIYKTVWDATPYGDELANRALEFVARTEPAANDLKPADVVDNSYFEKAKAELGK